MVKLILSNFCLEIPSEKLGIDEIYKDLIEKTGLLETDIYLTQNGRKIQRNATQIDSTCDIQVCLRLLGGKGGFGSMLRAIGAQIEKTTNREACRDLSGRRLRDINEEKRLKAYLEKKQQEEEDPEEKFQKKIGKLLAKPKHEFKDEQYDAARSDLTQSIDESVEVGFEKAKKIQEEKALASKRKAEETNDKAKKKKKKNKKGTLWLGAEFSSSSDTDSDDEASSSSDNKSEKPSNSSPPDTKDEEKEKEPAPEPETK